MEIPEQVKNVLAYALSGFVVGFNAAFVVSDFTSVDWDAAIKGALILGLYSAVKEALAYLQTILPKRTDSGNKESFIKKMF